MRHIRVETTAGVRICCLCKIKIPRHTKIITEDREGGPYFTTYNNYCPSCAVPHLKHSIKELSSMLNEIGGSLWDQ